METNTESITLNTNLTNLLNKQDKFKTLNIFVIDSQCEFFSNEISLILSNKIMFTEEDNKNLNHPLIKQYFFKRIGNIYNQFKIICLNPLNPEQSSNFIRLNIFSTMEDNIFLFKIQNDFSDEYILEIITKTLNPSIFNTIVFKYIGIFLEEKKNEKFLFDDYFNGNIDKIHVKKNFEFLEKKLSQMNICNTLIKIMLNF